MEEVKRQIISLGDKMTNCSTEVSELEVLLLDVGKGRAVAQLMEDSPHTIKDLTPEEKEAAEEARVAAEAEAAAAAAAAAAQKAAKASKGKDKGAPVVPVPVIIKKEEPPPETEEEIAARKEKKRKALAPIASESAQLMQQLRKSLRIKLELTADAALLPPPDHHKQHRCPQSTSILRPPDQEFEFFYELQEELHERGLDRLPRPYPVYKRLDMFKMIFKIGNVEAAFKHT